MKATFLTAIVLLGLFACAANPPPPEAPPVTSPAQGTAGSECVALAAKAGARVRSVLEANLACSTDADCTTVGYGAACFDACTRPMARAGEAAFHALVADVEAHECRDYSAIGCKPPLPPPCAPPPPATCKQGVCQ
jgi:hypothetical protein